MGMAAAQARFLGLTARKTNVEYEGQQINQQRTALANQSANYYNNLLGMTVPIPPSVDNYTKTVYTFDDGALNNSITAMIAQPNGKYCVSFLRQWTDDFSAVAAATSIITDNKDGTYNVGANKLRELGEPVNEFDFDYTFTDAANTVQTVRKEEGALPGTYSYYQVDDSGTKNYVTPQGGAVISKNSYVGSDNYLKTLTTEQIDKLSQEETQYKALLNDKYGASSEGWAVRYAQDTSSGKYVPYFYNSSQTQNAIYDDNGNSKSSINCYTIGSATKSEEVKGTPDCRIEQDSTGRYINVTFPDLDASGNPIVDPITGEVQYGATHALTTSTITDQDKYGDAMNQYEYDKYSYDQAIQEINAKIAIIQSQDKNLELRLKQLDTEQDAISTEMDAVTKVVEKNIETTFKTFG